MEQIHVVEPSLLDQANGYFAVVFKDRIYFNGRSKENVRKMYERCNGGNKRIYVMPSPDELVDLEHALKKAV